MARLRPSAARLRERLSEAEWAWLTAAADADIALGYFTDAAPRLAELWRALEDQVRAHWERRPPQAFPPGHPAGPGWSILSDPTG